MSDVKQHSLATPLMAVVFIIIAAIVFWDTTSYTDADSYVFPRAIAAIMAGLAVLSIIRWFIAPAPEIVSFAGANLRRLGLVAAMLGSVLAMPWLGFLISALLAYGAILALAMYDPWTPKRMIIYPLSGAGVVIGFYLLFKNTLQVPLPVGSLFGG